VRIDPFSPAPIKWSEADRAWRPVALQTLFRWYDKFVGQFPKSVVLYPHVPYLDEQRFYTAAELKQVMHPRDWNRLVAVHLDKTRGMATAVVFVNAPEESPDSHDLLGQAAALSAAQQSPFNLGSGIRALAEYRWFVRNPQTLYRSFDVDCKENPSDAVCTLNAFANRQLNSIIESLPEPQRGRVIGRSVSFDTQVSAAGTIWAAASLKTQDVKLSPLLIRTLFIQEADSCAAIQWKYRFPVEGPETAASGRYSLELGEPSLIADCYVRFGALLDYPLAHELAHVFLSEDPKASLFESEKCADVFAVSYMLSRRLALRSGLYGWIELLKAFDSEDEIIYFGFGSGLDDTKRLEQLRDLRQMMQSPSLSALGMSPIDAARKCVQDELAAVQH